jgi:hypothetical protein
VIGDELVDSIDCLLSIAETNDAAHKANDRAGDDGGAEGAAGGAERAPYLKALLSKGRRVREYLLRLHGHVARDFWQGRWRGRIVPDALPQGVCVLLHDFWKK